MTSPYPYLPNDYVEFVSKLYDLSSENAKVEDRTTFFYYATRGVNGNFVPFLPPLRDKPLAVDLVGFEPDNGAFKDLKPIKMKEIVLAHPSWRENARRFKKPTETIEVPYAVSPRKFGYLPKGAWIDEFVVYVELPLLPKEYFREEFFLALLEGKGTFVVLSADKDFSLPFPFLSTLIFGEFEKVRYLLPP